MIRQVGQTPVQQDRFIQFVVAPRHGEDVVHIQARGRQVNRGYGAAVNLDPEDNEFAAFLGGLYQSRALPLSTSLATSVADYMRLTARPQGDSIIFEGSVAQRPFFAAPFVRDGRIAFEVSASDLPYQLADSLH